MYVPTFLMELMNPTGMYRCRSIVITMLFGSYNNHKSKKNRPYMNTCAMLSTQCMEKKLDLLELYSENVQLSKLVCCVLQVHVHVHIKHNKITFKFQHKVYDEQSRLVIHVATHSDVLQCSLKSTSSTKFSLKWYIVASKKVFNCNVLHTEHKTLRSEIPKCTMYL